MHVKNLAHGIRLVRDRQRREDMEKAKTVVSLALAYVVIPVAALVAIRKIDKKFP